MPSPGLRPPPSAAATKRAANLHLSSLPRFHPGNFPTPARANSASTTSASTSASSSTAASPPSDPTSPVVQASTSLQTGGPARPQYHSRQYSDAQRKLHAHQREIMARNYYGTPFGANNRPLTPTSPSATDTRGSPRSPLSPRSPRLNPLGSPGPVTPFELEGEQDGYITGEAALHQQLNENAKDQILESFIQKESSMLSTSGPTSKASQARMPPYSALSAGLRRGDPAHHRSALSR